MNTPDSATPPSSSANSPVETRTPRRAVWKYAAGLAPGIIVWVVLVGWLAHLLYARAEWSEEADSATIREWIDEARNFRKTLPELVREYLRLRDETRHTGTPDPQLLDRLREKHDEIEDHMRGLGDPTRAYLGQLPSFPVIYRLEVALLAHESSEAHSIAWDSPLPHPRQMSEHRVRVLEYQPTGVPQNRALIRCEYQLHAFNKLQQREADRQRVYLLAGAVLIAATMLAVWFMYRFLQRERQREIERLTVLAEAEHQKGVVLEVRVRHQEAERERDELDRKLLHQELEAATLQKRADEAEKSALEMKSQLYASIGIMAGSYAHNIKNLLVRPNDLLARCLEADGLSHEQNGMLVEVRATLGTVTERLQQILRTIRRDPNNAETVRIDLAGLVRDTVATWAEMGRDKWKLQIVSEVANESLGVNADLSHLQQAIENLLFNARDATFEMRNHLREAARRTTDPTLRKQRLIEAAGWVGRVTLAARREDRFAVLEIRDTGIGMTDEVRANCMRTHFTTKRDNALYEGYSAGMGLGLSFVAVVLEHHGATLEIESTPMKGATFRVRFALAEEVQTGQASTENV